jgi:predicted metal-dependent hydrolase
MAVRRIAYGNIAIEYTVATRDIPAANVRIHVEADARVWVEAPADAAPTEIAAAVRKRARWISGHLERIRESKPRLMRRDWVSGESQRYLGRRYMLKVTHEAGKPEGAALAGGQLRVNVHVRDPQRVRGLALDWYRLRAREWLARRVADLAARLPWVSQAPTVAFRVMQSRWGSCSPNGRLTMNPLLVRAPREAIDYVIVHELCHLRHHHHGPAFYRLLDRYVPGWKVVNQRLDLSAESLFAEER